MTPSVQAGDKAPDFELPDASGEPVRLSELLGKKVVVLFFYPKDGSPICTAEACAFRDAYQVFAEAGAEVVGISSDAAAAHRKFAERHALPFVLLSDEDGKVRKLYGVSKTMGLVPGRATYVIDQAGIVRHTFTSQWAAKKHVHEALRIVRSIAPS